MNDPPFSSVGETKMDPPWTPVMDPPFSSVARMTMDPGHGTCIT